MRGAGAARGRQLAGGALLMVLAAGATAVAAREAWLHGAALLCYALIIVAAALVLGARGVLACGALSLLLSALLWGVSRWSSAPPEGDALAVNSGQLMLLSALLLAALRRRRRAERAMEQQLEARARDHWRAITDLAASRRSLSRTFHQLLRAREDERRRLARELHDGAVQQLMGIIIAVKHSPPEAAGEIVDQQVRLAINELRRLVSALRPADLEELGVSAALEQYVITLTGPRVPRLIAELDPIGPHELAWDATIAVFRVAQEALRNVIRHANAGQVRVTLRRHARAVTLNVSDNGVGFEATQRLSDLTWQMTQAQHFGLANMIEWAASVRGELIVTSAPGQGTQVRLRVPLAPLAYAWQSPTQFEGRGPESETQ